MLLDLRETVRNSKPIKYTLITVICIPFVLFGVGSYFSGGTAAPVAEVNGQPISQQQLERAYQQQRQQLARMFGGQLPEAFANEGILRQQALQQLITQQVLESEVVKQKFAVGDATLGRAIRTLPNFQIDGKFDADAYQTQLRASGMSIPAFEQSFRDDTAINQFRAGISDTSFTLAQETDRLSALSRQTRTVEAVRFDFDKAKTTIEVSEDDVVAYFDEHKDDYKFPQRAKIQYLELNSTELANDIDVSDEQAQTYYDDNRASFILPEQREASHILLGSADGDEADQIVQLNEIKARIEAGESFADLAKEFSSDIGSAELGGSLGVITPGAMVPEFETAVFALDATGALSEPVVSEFGVHLIQLDSVTAEAGKPFDEVREDIIFIIRQDEADGSYFDLREQLVEYAFDNPESLEPASDITGLSVKTTDWLDRDTDSGPVLSNPQILNALFSEDVLEEENNSDVIEIGQRHVVVLRVLEYEDQRPKALEDVRETVTETLKGERANEALDILSKDALSRLVKGDSAADITKSIDQELVTSTEQEALDRNSTLFDRGVVTQIFALAKPGKDIITHSATLSNGDLLVLRVDSVQVPDLPTTTEPDVVGVPDPRLGGTEFEVLLESLRGVADIDISAVASP